MEPRDRNDTQALSYKPTMDEEMAPAQGIPAMPRRSAQPESHSVDNHSDSEPSSSLKRISISAMSSPISSAPPTPNPDINHVLPTTPVQPFRRSSTSLSQSRSIHRSASSSSPRLMRTSSRSSVGGTQADNKMEQRVTPKRSISNLISGLRGAQANMEPIAEPVFLTAAEIAEAHFARELAAHDTQDVDAETVVILHDACYGHRFSRLRTTKTSLSMIVERPERLHAGVLGAAAAYVRLGGHHSGERNAPHPKNGLAAPPFKLRKTGRTMDITSSFVTNVHGTAWMGELKGMCDMAGERLAKGEKELSRAASPPGTQGRKFHEGDLYLCSGSLNAFQGALGGVADAVDAVFETTSHTKRAFVAVRPPGHHCSADWPSGFCWVNNVHVGLEYAAQTHGLTHAAIIDFDLHHGDGSQAITWQRNSKNNEKRVNAKPNSKLKLSPDIGYYSLHDINSYPCEYGDDEKVQAASLCIDNAHSQSIWNVHLQPWKTEDEFWQLYETRYRVILDKAKTFLHHHTTRLRAEGKVQTKAAIFISAGFDASEWEGAGMQRHKVSVPTDFYARLTEDVVALAQEGGSGCDGRVISVLEGGYSDRALCSGVLSHLSGLCSPRHAQGERLPAKREPAIELRGSSVFDDLDQHMSGLSLGNVNGKSGYDQSWWSAVNLTALEMKINPPPPPVQGKKVRVGQQPTYATPTESFAYKVVDPGKFARSISGTMRDVQMPARPRTPPPPEVDWVVATQELSKLLIPQNRQTRSCTAEELAMPKVKKERLSVPSSATSEEAEKPRQLRDRSKAPNYAELADTVRPASRSTRRTTIAELPSATAPANGQLERRVSRRSSMASSLSSPKMGPQADAPPIPSLPPILTSSNSAMKPPPVPASAGVQMKKARAPVARKLTGAVSGAISAPVSPATYTTNAAKQSAPSNGPSTTTNSDSADVDALASGMKRITLKVGSKDEHDRKMRDKLAAERSARALKGAETRRANKAAKDAAAAAAAGVRPTAQTTLDQRNGTTTNQSSSSIAQHPTETTTQPAATQEQTRPVNGSGNPASARYNAPGLMSAMSAQTNSLMQSAPQATSGAVSMQVPVASNDQDMQMDLGLDHNHQSQASVMDAAQGPDLMSEQAPSLNLTVNSVQPPPALDAAPAAKENQTPPDSDVSPPAPHFRSSNFTGKTSNKPLPIFTSTSAIPFSGQDRPRQSSVASLKTPTSPVVKSPRNTSWKHRNTSSIGSVGSMAREDGNGVSRSMLATMDDDNEVVTAESKADGERAAKQDVVMEGGDIWDVPETPKR